jgi:hypothetical protein
VYSNVGKARCFDLNFGGFLPLILKACLRFLPHDKTVFCCAFCEPVLNQSYLLRQSVNSAHRSYPEGVLKPSDRSSCSRPTHWFHTNLHLFHSFSNARRDVLDSLSL